MIKRSKFREISVSRVLHAGIGPIHGYFRDMTAFKKGHAPCFLQFCNFRTIRTFSEPAGIKYWIVRKASERVERTKIRVFLILNFTGEA